MAKLLPIYDPQGKKTNSLRFDPNTNQLAVVNLEKGESLEGSNLVLAHKEPVGVRAAGFSIEYLEEPHKPNPGKTDFDYRLKILVDEEKMEKLFDLRFMNDTMGALVGGDDLRFGRIIVPMEKGFNIQMVKEAENTYLEITGNF